MKRVTIRDVAAQADVSISTVSRVINGLSVDEELAARVREAIKTLNYQPDRRAQRLRTNDRNVVGLFVSDIENPFFTSLVRGVEDTALGNNMSIILCNTDEDAKKQQLYLNTMSQEHVAGLIIASVGEQTLSDIRKHLAPDIPLVIIDRDISDGEVDVVMVDNKTGAYNAVIHLSTEGYTKIAMINGDIGIKSFEDRYEGYCDALVSLGYSVNPDYVVQVTPKLELSYTAALNLLQNNPEIDAIFTGNNLITLGTLKAIRQLGLKVPDNIAIVGFDDMPWSSELCPPLTSIAQPIYEIGQTAMSLLLRRIDNPKAYPISSIMKTRLIIRDSSRKKI